MLTTESLPRLQALLRDAHVDGWLLFDFHGVNPIASGVLALQGMVTRRVFAYIPAEGVPHALTHAIEQAPWSHWPAEWQREQYSSWRSLEAALRRLLEGKKVAMEYSPGGAMPYLDRIPAGALEMVRAAGAEVVSSGELVSGFFAVLNAEQVASHERAAVIIARIAQEAFTRAAERARGGSPLHEHELQRWILDEFAREGLEVPDHGPDVAVGASAANPHYEPSAEHPVEIREGQTVLIDLWAREPSGIFADQTWMASMGAPSARAQEVWRAIRDARDAAIKLLTERVEQGHPVRGGELDDAARDVISERGFGEYFTHRTGHSIDPRSLHGSGPHLDNLESREQRLLIPGVAFSIEPGIYIPGEIGMRTEVNAVVQDGRVLITPMDYQKELIVL